jgi:hypothetical protein
LQSLSISEFRCGRSIGSAQEIFVCGDNRAIRIELNHRLRLADCSTCASAAYATELLCENISKFPFVPENMKARGRRY